MYRRSLARRCPLAAAAAAAAAPSSSSSSSSPSSSSPSSSASAAAAGGSSASLGLGGQVNTLDHARLLDRYEGWLTDQRIDLRKVEVKKMNPTTGRGLFARTKIVSGEIVVSVPMRNLALSATALLSYSPAVQYFEPPQIDAVKRLTRVRGIQDPVISHLLHLALVIAAERSSADSFFSPYFDVLPHPAIPDTEVMAAYKTVLEAPAILEWGEQRNEFGVMLQKLVEQWCPDRAPPFQIVDWAWRTVLSRQHMLPDLGLTPQAANGSNLNYGTFAALNDAERTGITAKVKMLAKAATQVLPSGLRYMGDDRSDEYRLMPTLVPILDQIGHLPVSNTSVEVAPRGDLGSCAELQAIRDVEPGEEIGMSLSRAHSAAFTLYRFGFLPV